MADQSPVRVPLPASLRDTARAFVASGARAATPRVAATVVLLRPSGARLQVFVLRRAASMAFAARMHAFPGGSVDERDADVEVGWVGPDAPAWGRRLGLTDADARAVVCAAVREVFEECGVLLAGPSESTVVGDVSSADWEAARLALIAREVSIAELLTSRRLVLRSDLLLPWARWITPEFEPRRFDTFFFLARLPELQRTRDVGGEAEHILWTDPADAAGLAMLPPTAHTLRELAMLGDIDRALAATAGRDLTAPVNRAFHLDEDGLWLELR